MKRKQINSLFDITIEQYQKYLKIKDPDARQIISVFYSIPYELTADMSVKQINEQAIHVLKVLEQDPKHYLKYKGYGFEPDLNNMTAGAFADAFNYVQNEDTIHLFTAVMYRKLTTFSRLCFWTKKYEIEPYKSAKEMEDEAKQMPLALFFSAKGFFFDLRQSFLNVIQQRVRAKSKHPKVLQKQTDSTGIGDGVLNSMQSLVETTLKLNELQKSLYLK